MAKSLKQIRAQQVNPRTGRCWKQEELAEALGVHRVTIGNYEQGVTKPRKSLLFMAATVLGVPPEDIEGYTS